MRAFPWLSILLGAVAMNADSKTGERLAPEFSHSAAGVWINSPPQSIAALRQTCDDRVLDVRLHRLQADAAMDERR